MLAETCSFYYFLININRILSFVLFLKDVFLPHQKTQWTRNSLSCNCRGLDSSAGIATGFGPDGSGFEYGRRKPSSLPENRPNRLWCWPIRHVDAWFLSVKLIAHLHLVQRLRMAELYSSPFITWIGITFHLCIIWSAWGPPQAVTIVLFVL